MKKLKIYSVILLSIFAFGPANAADFVIKLAHNGPEQHPFQDGAVAFKSELETSTNGAIEVQIFPGEQLGDEEATSQMIKLGTLQCAIESAGGGLAPFVPEADLLNLPFVFNDVEHFYRVVDGEVGTDLAEKVETALDAEFMGWYFSGIRNVWNDERAVKTPDDLKGLKIRVMGSPVLIDTFNRLKSEFPNLTIEDVVMKTCKQRLRPILLTTATTIFGLLPLALGVSVDVIGRELIVGSRVVGWWQNLASSIVFGLAFSTILTLIFTPAALILPSRIKSWLQNRFDFLKS